MSTAFARNPKPYADPYGGVGLGLVLLAAFVIMGRQLARQAPLLPPRQGSPTRSRQSRHIGTSTSPYLAEPGDRGAHGCSLRSSVVIGGFRREAGGRSANCREGPRMTDRSRLTTAFGGGR
jgi:hypothetical protein